MDWKEIRAAFVRARGRRSQTEVAIAGGLRQNAISKMEANGNLGPSVETFVKAIAGLGLPVSTFFAQIESLHRRPATTFGVLRGLPATIENAPPPATPEAHDDDTLPAFESEERIAQRVLQRLAEYAFKGNPSERPADYRLPPAARPLAAERNTNARKPRRRDVPRQTKKRRRRKPGGD